MTGAASKRKGRSSWLYMLIATALLAWGIFSTGWFSGLCFITAMVGYVIGIMEAISGR